MTSIRARLLVCSCSALLLAGPTGCGDDDDDTGGGDGDADADGDGDADADGDGDGDADVYMPPLAELPEEEWTELRPGGDTICSRGTEFAFFVVPGSVNRVVLDFVGGGACWNEATCGFADAIFNPDVEDVREAVASGVGSGIYDRYHPDNPVRNWTHVLVPYCTGDVHWGDATVTYGEGEDAITIHHRGAVNARAVLGWLYENVPDPEHVFVTGCSAGSYGSILWSAHVMEHYSNALVTQFGDSGAGVITDEFFRESFPSWNATLAFPVFIPALDPEQVELLDQSLIDLYAGIGNYFGTQRISQYDSAYDENQTFYFQAMGGSDAEEWSRRMFASIGEIHDRTPSFSSFIPSGEQHCIIPYDNFYTVNVDGRLLTDYLQDMIDREPIERLTCAEGTCDRRTP
jgi:hypothetical protein